MGVMLFERVNAWHNQEEKEMRWLFLMGFLICALIITCLYKVAEWCIGD